MNDLTVSPSSAGTAQANPQPALICLGTGIRRPGMPAALQFFSMAMDSAVV